MSKTSTADFAATASSSWIDTLQALDPKSFLKGFFSKSTRPDGRLFSMCRSTTVTLGILKKNTVGSSLVRLGNTQVLCGVTLQIGVPSVPNMGDVVVSSSPELQTILTEMVDLTCLSISEGKAAWRLQVTLQVLQNDGNLWDASLLAAVAALKDSQLPMTQQNSMSGQFEIVESSDSQTGKALDFHYLPVPLTVGVYCDDEGKTQLLADSTPEEEPLLQGQLTMVVNDDNEIVFMEHATKVGLTGDDLAVCAHMTFGRAREIRSLLEDEV